jgi:hypothetical protein
MISKNPTDFEWECQEEFSLMSRDPICDFVLSITISNVVWGTKM